MHLVVHVGYYKTGTTALQNHLDAHAGWLRREQGVLYPRAGRPGRHNSNHSGLALQLLHESGRHLPGWYKRTRDFQDYLIGDAPTAWESLVSEIRDVAADTVILSSEEFTRFATGVEADVPRRFLEEIAPSSISAVCYVRRPDLYLEAWYNQLIKIGTRLKRLSNDLDRFLGTVHTNYDWVVGYWMDVIGGGDMIVRNYDDLIGGDVVDDFSATIGLRLPPGKVGRRPDNVRIDNNFVEYVRRLARGDDPPSPDQVGRMLDRVRDDPTAPDLRPVTVLDMAAREKLYEHSLGMNRRLGELTGQGDGFFHDLEKMLEIPDATISDLEALAIWKPYLDRARRQVVTA